MVLHGVGVSAGSVSRLGHRIEARRTEGAAAQQTAHREPQPVPGAVRLERLSGVGRARGREPTGRRPALRAPLIPVDHADEATDRPCRRALGAGDHGVLDWTRRSRRCTSPCSCSNVCSLADGRAPMSNHPAVSPYDGAASATITRSRRRNRLRSTARPYGRATEYPTRSGDAWGSLRNRHHRVPVRKERPDRASRSKAARPWILPIKRSAGSGP